MDDFVAALVRDDKIQSAADLEEKPLLVQEVFESWIAKQHPQLGCIFAHEMLRAPGRWGHDWRSVAFCGNLGADRFRKNINATLLLDGDLAPDAVCAIFPRLKTEDDIVELINALCHDERWCWEEIPHDGEGLFVGLRWMLPSGRSGSWVLGFAPTDSMPFTRRAPFTALVFRARESTRSYPDGVIDAVHLADLKVPHCGDQVNKLWESTARWKKQILSGELEDAARAKVTFALRCERRDELPKPTTFAWGQQVRGKQTVWTVGYEGRSSEELMATLKEHKVKMLLDCRLVPNSRGKPEFAKKNLAAACLDNGVAYEHRRKLGTPREILDRVKEAGGYDPNETEDYRRYLLNDIDSLQGAIDVVSRQSTCLLCAEADATNCHRKVIADEIADRYPFDVVHL